jgi:Methyltransferase domain
MPFTTRIRNWMNRSLGMVGLKINTTRADRAEDLRLKSLVARGHWSTPRFAAGLQFDDQKYLRLLTDVCLPYREQYSIWPQTHPALPNGFYLNNVWFGPIDAEVLYSIVRFYHPSTIVEVGSGFSTRVVSHATSDGGLHTRLHSIDPLPRVEVQGYADEHLQCGVEELDPSEVARSLKQNDILFIDSSHTVTNGGDVPFLFLEVVPRLAAGVLIHVHDIFLPFDYPQEWIVENGWKWNEQYLVQALLYGSNTLEILWPAHYMWRRHRSELREMISSDAGTFGPSSLWLRKLV